MKKDGIHSMVGSVLRNLLDRHPAFAANPFGDWNELVGEQLARHTRPVSLKGKTLIIAAYDSVWKHHLELNADALKDKINGKRPEHIVDRIVIRVGEVPESSPVLNPCRRELEKMKARAFRVGKKEKKPVRNLTPEEKELLKSISDPELKAVGRRLLKRLPIDENE
ncbi:MAG: DUF721 domain-containing protein [Syntrophobacteraceae bacterium]|nr:DUF721 domain-containing protein [Syntrophobacteraceae bacterium]